MRWKSVLVLVLLLGGLVLVWQARARDRLRTDQRIEVAQYTIFEGFAPERVIAIRIDHTLRGQVKFERDVQGSWFLTDPIAYPASVGIIQALFRTMSGARGEPAGDIDLAAVELAPPLAVIEFTQRDEAGTDRVYRLEIGSVDLTDDLVYVRVPGHSQSREGEPIVLLCTRAIANTLERSSDDYRDTRATHLSGIDVVAFERRGSVYLPERNAVIDLGIEAELGVDGWKKLDSPTVRLESAAIGLVAGGAAELSIRRFTTDTPRSFAEWGLDPPQFSITLHSRRGDPVQLDFGYPTIQGPALSFSEVWYCRRVGSPHVWELEASDVSLLVQPSEYLYDYFLVHALRDEMERVELEALGRTLVLERAGARWTVSTVVDGVASDPFPASTDAVQNVLAVIEKTELSYPLPADDGAPIAFTEAEQPISIAVTTKDGERWGGRIGEEWRDTKTGLIGRLFVRFGDELTGVVEEAVVAQCLLGIDHFRSSQVHRVRESGVRMIELRHGGEAFSYVHPDDKRWLVAGTKFDAPRRFMDCLQFLLSIRADRWLDGVDEESFVEHVDATIELKSGDRLDFRIGRLADGTLACLESGLAAEISREQLEQHALAWGGEFFPTLLLLFGE